MSTKHSVIPKRATGIEGFDIISQGGLPADGITLLQGDAGAGKTLFALNVVANAAKMGSSSIFVAFEEPIAEILRNSRSFDWQLDSYVNSKLFTVDARAPGRVEISGSFDISGLLAALSALAAEIKPDWIVFDGLDQLLMITEDRLHLASELRRLHEWLRQQNVSAMITAKHSATEAYHTDYLNHLRFHVGTVISLSTTVCTQHVSRRLRITKYRGSAHAAEEVPLVLDTNGVNLPYSNRSLAPPVLASSERVGSGVGRLDTLLGGGYFRGTTTLITGAPGTSKTSFAAAFIHAAAQRGERSLYISFDETASQIIRNMRSIGIDLKRHVDAEILTIVERRSWRTLIEEHYLEILRTLDRIEPSCVVIDPISAMQKNTNGSDSLVTIERLCDVMKDRGITTVMTSLLDTETREEEKSAAHVSTIADAWLSLTYQVRSGERNRAISIVKARGTRHSNQVREVMLSDTGINLADVYTLGTEVLMGTARLQREYEVRQAHLDEEKRERRQQLELEKRLQSAQTRAAEVEREIAQLQRELSEEQHSSELSEQTTTRLLADIRNSRSDDSANKNSGN